jgi:CheY-like chemotaxis protein
MERDEEPATILFIEDNDDDVEMVKRTLGRSGVPARLRLVRDAAEAMQTLRATARDDPDGQMVVLLDLLLPAAHGLDVIEAIRTDERLADTPIVVLTGSSDVGLLRRCMELGTNMYLLKPLNVADVMNILVGVRRYWRSTEGPDGASERQPVPMRQRSPTWTTPQAA